MKYLFLILAFSLVACGSRVPPPKTAHSVTQSYFKRYGKKYGASLFGNKKIQSVEINRVTEQSLNHAEIEAFLTLENGSVARVLLNAEDRPPLGWKIRSWEMVDLR